uniref:Nuclear export mediator factor Nemf n=2 Tax=Anthurium amnicola TaxID=1678845 RepID=A0A1D1XET7_9ARAE
MRKVHWFEKFNWFISSENYLVISGRDAQQNEMIVKRYTSKGDLYVHADLHGASSTVIKNHKPDYPVPPLTLNQAGCFTVCQSQAWDSKIVTSAWWVYPHQVSKTAPTGEYLTVGSFMIRGKKNFLPPHPLVMGFGILFRLDESSLSSHLNERRVRGEDEGLLDAEEFESPKGRLDSELGDLSGEVDTNKIEESPDHLSNNHSEPGLKDIAEIDTTHTGSSPVSMMVETSSNLVTEETDNLDNIGSDSHCNEVEQPSVSLQLEVLLDRALGLGPVKGSSKHYTLDAPKVSTAEDNGSEETKVNIRDKPYISKAERRKVKKGQMGKNDSENALPDGEENKKSNMLVAKPDNNVDNQKSAPSKVTRGQKGKLKKIKEKYAEQDDEERIIRMALLASAGKANKNAKEPQGQDMAAGKEIRSIADSSKICYKCKKAGHLSRDCQEFTDEADNGKAIKTKVASNVASEDPMEEKFDKIDGDMADRVAIEEDDIREIVDEREKLNDLDYFTGNPLPSDILLYAVPVCGPYNALQVYKYRVKITPGTAKKGKAAKTAMNLFSHMPEATNREKELMKACTDAELVAAIIGNVKITAPGLTQLKQKQKKEKKSGRDK